jgi:hypothetical protein
MQYHNRQRQNSIKIAHGHSKALGGTSRITFMMNPASLPHAKLMRATKLIGTRVASALREV